MKLLLHLLIFAMCGQLFAHKTLYILPPPDFETDEKFFNLHARDDIAKVFCELRRICNERGYECTTYQGACLDEDDYLLVCEFYPSYAPLLEKIDRSKIFLIMFEPPSINPYEYHPSFHHLFNKIFTMIDALVDNRTYYKFCYPQPSLVMHPNATDWTQKKLCTMIAGNKNSYHVQELYSERRAAIAFFEQFHADEFDLYGTGWPSMLRTYKGCVNNKFNALQNYKFCICYENTRDLAGYVTEKIFDSFVAGCVPIYFGSETIDNYIPTNCFIDKRRFSTYEDLYHFLRSMKQQDFEQYLTNINQFLSSSKSEKFSINYFIDTVLENIICS